MHLANVKFMASQPKEMMPRLWSVCDVALIPLKNDPLYTKMIPSKLFEVMGMGVPAIVALPEGEATRIVRQYGTGIVVPPEQPTRLAAVILELYNKPEEVAALRQASAAAAPFFSRTSQAEKMLEVFQAVVAHTPGLARATD
jgi:glycosyltransferase involved in cell wall biosynthesis